MFAFTLDFSITDWDIPNLLRSLETEFNEAFDDFIAKFLEHLLQDAPLGLPVLTGEAKKGFEDVASKYGVLLSYNPNTLNISRYSSLFRPEDFSGSAVQERRRYDRASLDWSLSIDIPHFIDNEFNSQDFKNQQRPMPWNLLLEAKNAHIAELRARLVSIIGTNFRRWKIKASRREVVGGGVPF